MALGEDTVTVRLGPAEVALRPSLRAALALARRHGSPAALASLIAGGSLQAARDTLQHAGGVHPDAFTAFLEAQPVGDALQAIRAPLLAFCLLLAIPAEADGTEAPTEQHAEPVTWPDAFERLYTIATGWLGYTPADAWHATPTELAIAYRGRLELLRAVFGGGEEKPKRPASLDDRARLAFARFDVVPA